MTVMGYKTVTEARLKPSSLSWGIIENGGTGACLDHQSKSIPVSH